MRRPNASSDQSGRATGSASPRTLALRYLARRDYTSRELIGKLTLKGIDPDTAEATVRDLAVGGFVDDRRAAHAHVRTASRVKGRGPRRIRLELEARGVEKATINEAVAAISQDDIDQTIARLVARKLPAGSPSADDRNRLFRQLLRRGFPASAIEKALK